MIKQVIHSVKLYPFLVLARFSPLFLCCNSNKSTSLEPFICKKHIWTNKRNYSHPLFLVCIWNTLTHLSQRVARKRPLITNIEKTGDCLCILYHAKEKINRYCWKSETKVLCFIPTGGWTLPLPVVVMNASSLWLPGAEGRGGCFYTPASHSVPFVPLENPEILKRAQKDEPGVLATESDPSVVQQGEELQMSFFFFFNKWAG